MTKSNRTIIPWEDLTLPEVLAAVSRGDNVPQEILDKFNILWERSFK